LDKKILYRKAYRILQDSTPLKFDCGMLCNSRCCQGGDEAGMCLYPGEECMLDKSSDFLSIRKEKLLDMDVLFAVCGGKCDRRSRPLACRIFPYVPYLDPGGRLTIIEDPRAKYLCPLLMEPFELKIDKIFRRKVKNVFQLLAEDNDIKCFLTVLSSVLDEYGKFTSRGF